MTEQEEFAQFSQSIVSQAAAEAPPPAEPVAEAPKDETSTEQKPVAETPKVELKDEPKPEAKPVDWKDLAAKEKERRAQKSASRLAQQQREREFIEAKAKADKLERIMALSKEKRLAALSELGMSLDDVNTEYIRDLEENPNKTPPAILAAQKELAEIRAELKAFREEKERITAEQQKIQHETISAKVKSEYTARAASAIKAKADEFETLSKHPQGSEVVFHLIAAHYAQTATFDDAGNVLVPGEELDVNEACRRVEAGLLEQLKWTADVKKLRGSAKAPDSTTLAGDMRQQPGRTEPTGADDDEFKQVALRLLKQQAV